jgi:predicted ATPase
MNGLQGGAPPLLLELTPRNILSFGPETPPLALRNLNVLIGPNGSGKSNLIEVVALLRGAANDIGAVIRRGGGVGEWVWKGNPETTASIDASISYQSGSQSLRHLLQFRSENQVFRLSDEQIERRQPTPIESAEEFWYRFRDGSPEINSHGQKRALNKQFFATDSSILSQRRDPQAYPEFTFLAEMYQRIRIYREWEFGRSTVFREPQRADWRSDRLEDNFSNLGLILNRLRRNPRIKRVIQEKLKDVHEGFDDFDVSIEGGTVQVFFTEGDFTIPATRLSDGTLRYLCLLAILCDPEPPPLICIEEPELGLHPDLLPKIADLLVEASARTQLIVTTHSDILIDALTEQPEAVIVCEKHAGQTTMQRLDADALSVWLGQYRLGQLWTRGEIGGTRW